MITVIADKKMNLRESEMNTKLEEVTPSSEQGENEMRMCADCLGYGRVDKRTCVYCKGTGRVLTARALLLRQERDERLKAAAPALYEACRDALEDVTGPITSGGIKIRYSTRDKLSTALALVDGPQETK